MTLISHIRLPSLYLSRMCFCSTTQVMGILLLSTALCRGMATLQSFPNSSEDLPLKILQRKINCLPLPKHHVFSRGCLFVLLLQLFQVVGPFGTGNRLFIYSAALTTLQRFVSCCVWDPRIKTWLVAANKKEEELLGAVRPFPCFGLHSRKGACNRPCSGWSLS